MFVKGLKDVVAVRTKIASVDGDKGELRYRGQLAEKVIENRTFEETAFFLWKGAFPDFAERDELHRKLLKHRNLPQHVTALIQTLPADMPLMDGMRTAVSAFSHNAFQALPRDEQAISLTAALPVITAALYRRQKGLDAVAPDESLGHTANYLWMLTGQKPAAAQTEALETYLKLTMEHGLNASTFAARVTISTESDLTAAVTSALGTMKGPLHGGAPSGVIELLKEIGTPENTESVILAKLQAGERIMGFGHRVYRTEDPRSVLLRKKCLELQGQDAWLDLAAAAERDIIRLLAMHKPGRALYTNVEFYAAAIMRSIDMPPALFTPSFSIARIVGWTAHAMEQLEDNVIFRPQSEYVGSYTETANH